MSRLSRCPAFVAPALMVVALLGISGCGGGADADLPATAPVEGTLTYKGSPVTAEGVQITFYPDGEGNPGHGTVDSSGKFVLSTYGQQDGAVIGSHKITVEYIEAGALPGAAPSDPPVPAKYASLGTTTLQQEVTEGQNQIELQLDD